MGVLYRLDDEDVGPGAGRQRGELALQLDGGAVEGPADRQRSVALVNVTGQKHLVPRTQSVRYGKWQYFGWH